MILNAFLYDFLNLKLQKSDPIKILFSLGDYTNIHSDSNLKILQTGARLIQKYIRVENNDKITKNQIRSKFFAKYTLIFD